MKKVCLVCVLAACKVAFVETKLLFMIQEHYSYICRFGIYNKHDPPPSLPPSLPPTPLHSLPPFLTPLSPNSVVFASYRFTPLLSYN